MDDFVRLIPLTATHFLEVCARVSSKVATNGSFRGKRISKINILRLLFYIKNGGVGRR